MAEQETLEIEAEDLDAVAALDELDGEPTLAEATLEQFDEDSDLNDNVEEALRAWAAGGHSAEEESAGDEILPVHFAQLEPPPPQKIKPRFSRINNVFVDITVELGRREMSVRELKDMKVQNVIDLEKLAGEAFDILINKRPFALGEIVVVTDLMAVRITALIDRKPPEEAEE
jgi:flagellar motor switch protein FliN/FliY